MNIVGRKKRRKRDDNKVDIFDQDDIYHVLLDNGYTLNGASDFVSPLIVQFRDNFWQGESVGHSHFFTDGGKNT